jgi:hypothetical protein
MASSFQRIFLFIKRLEHHLLFNFIFLTVAPMVVNASTESARRAGVQVNDVNVDVKDVFDTSLPQESAWPYRFVNKLHIHTRASVIRRELLAKPGETVTELTLEESERNLRALDFIKSAKVEHVPVPGEPKTSNKVNLNVTVQDAWTTQPQANFGSVGGQSSFSLGFVEENFLGYGKTVSYFNSYNAGVSENDFSYMDPQFLNTRWHLDGTYNRATTGDTEILNLQRPFYSINTRYSYGGTVNSDQQLQKLYQNGNEISRYTDHHHDYETFFGTRLNNDPLVAYRLTVRYRDLKDQYFVDPLTEPGTLPANKAYVGPLLQWTRDPSDFIKDTFVDKAGRVEDINLGHQFVINSGFSGRSLGATDNTIPIGALHSFGFGEQTNGFGLVSYGLAGRYVLNDAPGVGHRFDNMLYFATFNGYRHGLTPWPLTHVVHAETAWLQNADTQNLLQLGGDTGLRAFKIQSFTGNKSMLLNYESRLFYPDEVFRLAYLGGAIFAEGGQVQPQGDPFNRNDFRADVGLGLRVGLTRSSGGSLIRLDVAYAIGQISQGHRIIVSISSSPSFKRTANTYANYPDIPSP